MKKRISLLVLLALSIAVFTACGGKKDGKNDKIIIGVSPNPHAEIVRAVQEDLKAQGIDIEVKEFTDYTTPNIALDGGDIQMNFFQHQPYLDEFNESRNLDLVSIGTVHLEPMALYSKTIKSLDELTDGNTIAIPNDAVNGGRALLLLQANGVIELDPNSGLAALPKDITSNPKNLKFKTLEAPILPTMLGEVDAAVINGNYALESNLNPLKDGIVVEGKDSPYANVIAVRAEDKDREDFKKIVEALNSEKARTYILETYDGVITPAF